MASFRSGVSMRKKQAVNPFLPGYEYVPDGEPRIFWSEKDQENRVYLYGSHGRGCVQRTCRQI